MKKLFVVAIALIAPFNSHSQSYSFKKVFTQVSGFPATFIKVNGSVTISDTVITLIQDGQKSDMNVTKVSPNQYKSKVSEDSEIRFSFTPDYTKKESENYILVMEMKDKFSGKLSSFMYTLVPLK